ncbi:MAG TPA: hypothetical protein VFS08_02030 [Gemmatimonadaceae bacterium]|nr:hypothetical protein [Gemmatimonadaceae bacterium]
MAVFQQSRTLATCDECRVHFDPVRGGVCPQCRRLLCGTHYYGSPLRRLQGLVGGRPRCVACREGREPVRREPPRR